MKKDGNNNISENISFLALVALFLAVGSYFALIAAISRISPDDQLAGGVARKVQEKKLDSSILDNQKMKQLEVHPREKYDRTRVKAGGKKCPFGGLE